MQSVFPTQYPLVLCAVCNRKEKVSFFFPSFSFLISFLVHVYVGGGISLLHSVTQKNTYLKIIVWCALCLEILSVLDGKKCEPLKTNKQR